MKRFAIMKRFLTHSALVLCLAFALVAVTGCDSSSGGGDENSQVVVYRVTGDMDTARLSYYVPPGPNGNIAFENPASLPWESEEIDLAERNGVANVTAAPVGEGTITAQILDADGNVLDEATAESQVVRADYSFE